MKLFRALTVIICSYKSTMSRDGRWDKIKKDAKFRDALAQRSIVDLKDKWRNLRRKAARNLVDLPCYLRLILLHLEIPCPSFPTPSLISSKGNIL